MPVGRALLVLLAVVVVIGGYVAITMVAGLREPWVGYLLLFYWGTMEELKPAALPRSVAGAACGLSVAMVPAWLTPVLGAATAGGVMLGAVVLTIWLLLRRQLPLLVNPAMLLFVTVMTIPRIQGGASPLDLFAGLAAGLIFFGGLRAVAALAAPSAEPRPEPGRQPG